MPETPAHWSAPFTIARTGVKTVEQDSAEDVADCVLRICQCREGFREDSVSFGIPELLFQAVPLDLSTLEEAIERWEPRATPSIIERAARTLNERNVGVEV